jgi:4-methyl-5(b-hydroxyethyl)-thiazole monophosphate biosynthesis
MSTVLLLLAEGFEEVEAIAVVDVLRRAEIQVTMAGLQEGPIKSARGVRILPDATLDEINPDLFDMVVLPGGMPGTDNLAADQRVRKILTAMVEKQKYAAAICAAPYVLSEAGILKSKRVTSYPSFQPRLQAKEVTSDEKVVVDGNVVTSQGAGTALNFALKIVELFKGTSKSEEIRKAMLITL